MLIVIIIIIVVVVVVVVVVIVVVVLKVLNLIIHCIIADVPMYFYFMNEGKRVAGLVTELEERKGKKLRPEEPLPIF